MLKIAQYICSVKEKREGNTSKARIYWWWITLIRSLKGANFKNILYYGFLHAHVPVYHMCAWCS